MGRGRAIGGGDCLKMTTMSDTNLKYREAALAASQHPQPDWLKLFRSRAWNEFEKLGFPTTQHEEWKYCNVRPISEGEFQSPLVFSQQTNGYIENLGDDDAYLLAFVNGIYDITASKISDAPVGLTIDSLASVLKNIPDLVKPHLANYANFEGEAFVALNTATFVDGAVVRVADNVVVEKPIFLVNYTTSGTAAPVRNLVIMERNSQATVIEIFLSENETSFSNIVTEIVVSESAVLNHTKVQLEGGNANHISTQVIEQSKSSVFDSQNICLGASLARTTIYARLGAEHIECTIDGLYCLNNNQLVDNHTTIDHAFPNCNSFELYKGVMDEKSTGVFNGKIFVRQDAQKTDSKQTNQNLLLSDDATINTKPQLEIYADDVRCTHGATVGRLDPNALFYLQARGIGAEEARSILVHAFANEVIQRVKPVGLRTELEKRLYQKLG